jgi:hypothetical protein
MSEPAILDAETTGATDVSPELLSRLRAAWSERWLPLRDAIREHPPLEDSPEEIEALRRFGRVMLSVVIQTGASTLSLLVAKAQGGIEAMWRREYAETSVERRLGMRLVGQALGTLADLLQELHLRRNGPPVLTDAALAEAEADLARIDTWPPSMHALLRLELSAFVAFDLASLDDTHEFCLWARRAVGAARQAAAHWHASPFAAPSPIRPWSEEAITSHLVLTEPEAARVAELLDHPPEPNDALRAFLGDD